MVWVFSLLLVYLLVIAVVAWFSLHPFRTPLFFAPGSLGARQEDHTLPGEAGPIQLWWLVPAKPPKLVFVMTHGYMMNRSELAAEGYRLWQEGCAIALMECRAHGRSGGKVSTLGWEERKDIAVVARWAREQYPDAKLILMGSSMGAAASAMALGDDPTLDDGLVLDSAYGKLTEAVSGWWRFLGGKGLALAFSPLLFVAAPFLGFNPWKVDVADALAKLPHVPILFFHGKSDTLALPAEAERNVAAHRGEHQIEWFERCGHSEGRWLHPERYWETLNGFLRKHDFLG